MPARHRVNQVVDADHFQVNVAPRGVDQVIASDGRQVTVAGVLPQDFRFLAPAQSKFDNAFINVEAYAPLIFGPQARARAMGMQACGDVLANATRASTNVMKPSNASCRPVAGTSGRERSVLIFQ